MNWQCRKHIDMKTSHSGKACCARYVAAGLQKETFSNTFENVVTCFSSYLETVPGGKFCKFTNGIFVWRSAADNRREKVEKYLLLSCRFRCNVRDNQFALLRKKGPIPKRLSLAKLISASCVSVCAFVNQTKSDFSFWGLLCRTHTVPEWSGSYFFWENCWTTLVHEANVFYLFATFVPMSCRCMCSDS